MVNKTESKMTAVNAHSTVYNTHQLVITAWLRQELGLPKDAPVYFDDADLVWYDKTVMKAILINPTARLGRLRRALQKHIAQL
jgi:hypothetical protein